MAKKIRLEFTGPELNQLYSIMVNVIADGDYYGPKETYYKTSRSIISKISGGLERNAKGEGVK